MKRSADYTQKVLEVSNLKQYFKTGVGKHKLIIKAVDDISFDIYKKEVFGLVGESGCGKTTTGRTLIRLYRPTSGNVLLDGEYIGSGADTYKEKIRLEKNKYKIELLKLNAFKYEAYKLTQEANKKIDKVKQEIQILEQEYLLNVKQIRKNVDAYDHAVFNENGAFKINLERLKFDFTVHSDRLLNQTKNELLIERNGILGAIKETYYKKVDGIKNSAALSKEARDKHLKEAEEAYLARVQKTHDEFDERIVDRSEHLLSKANYKKQINILKQNFEKEKVNLIEEHKSKLSSFAVPDYEAVKSNLKIAKAKLKTDIKGAHKKIVEIKKQLKVDKSKINASNQVDMKALETLKSEHLLLISKFKHLVRQSNKDHWSKQALTHTRKMQMIFQDPISSLNPRMTVQEIVSEGLVINKVYNNLKVTKILKDKKTGEEKTVEVKATKSEINERIKAEVVRVLELVGLAPEYISRYPHEFSGGQRQRIGIARALIMNPSIIVADEPISALDVSIKAQVINLLSELKEKLDLTILFIAHDLSVVKYFCDQIAVMYFGKIVEMATSEELFKNPLHGYTKSLLSAIPQPDPDFEKERKRIPYSPSIHNYSEDKPEFVEIKPGHFIYANQAELEDMRKALGDENEH